MKSMTKMMLVAMILAAALVVAPVAAGRTITDNGTNVFIGEENLNFSTVVGTSDFIGTTKLVHYTGEVGKSSIDKTLTVNAVGNITEFTKGMPVGSYYAIGSTYPDVTYVNVMEAELAADIVLNTSKKDSVAGKSVTRDTKLDFKLTNNVDIPGARVDIEVTMPGGGVVTNFGGQNLRNIPVDGTTAYIGAVDLTGEAAGKYVVQAKWPNRAGASDLYGKGFDSAAGTFEVLTKSLAIESTKDSVVRGNSFTVTITGESKMTYDLYIKDVGGLLEGQYPWILDGQNGVTKGVLPAPAALINATVETNAGGTRSVQFNTGSDTDDRSFTIRVENRTTPNIDYDEVKVRVEKGSVTITSSGTGTYYIGEEVTLSGTCTDNDTKVHLFMTGPNLASSNGVNLLTLNAVENNNVTSFNTADVKSDDSWSFKWNTGDISLLGGALDSGGYTIYAVSKPLDKSRLSDTEYATASVQLRSGFITATSSGAVIAKGDDLKLTGTAQGDPDNVAVWIFGKNLQVLADPATVEDDASFEYELKGSRTKDLAAGQYFVVIQHPMMNNVLDIFEGPTAGWIMGSPGSGFNPVRISGLQASDAATALINAIDSPNIDDTYVKLTFVVEEANIWVDAIGDKAAGSKFTITGTTNLAVGDTLNIEVTSAAFKPTTKTEASGFGSVAGTTTVKQGDGANTWSFEVDGSSFKADQYIVKVECIETDTTATATFNVVEAVPTQVTPTTTGTAVTTPTTPPATPTPTPTQSPGFGALLALAGLGAVAFLVLRRD